jgi:1-acyl-sn-glycerol-3-phosphate acyltransferase
VTARREAPSAYDGGPHAVWAVSVRVLDLAVRLLGRVTVTGREHLPASGGALLAANHVSAVDPVVLLVVGHRCGRKVRFLGVQELHHQPVLGWFVRAGRHIPVVQGAASRAPLLAAEQALRAGELVLVYPEGTIPRDGASTEAKGGIGLLALRAGVPVVPLRSRGLEPRAVRRWRPWRRLRVSVAVGAPVALPEVGALRGSARYTAVGSAVLDAVRRL